MIVVPVELAALCERIYKGYGGSGKVGIPYFLHFREELSKFDEIEFLVLNFRKYPHVYVSELMLAAPFVWQDFTSREWIALLRAGSPRPNPRRLIEESSSFCDLEILVKYLRLSALDVYAKDPLISDLDKMSVRNYFQKFPYLLDPDDDDWLEGESLIGVKELKRIRAKLAEEGVFSPSTD